MIHIVPFIAAAAAFVCQPADNTKPDFRSQAPYREQLRRMHQERTGPNAYPALLKAKALLDKVGEDLPPRDDDRGAWIQWSALSDPSADAAERERATTALAIARESGIDAIIAEVAAGRTVVRQMGEGLIIADTLADPGAARACVHINRARMEEDARAGRWDQWFERVRENLQIGRLYTQDEYMIMYLVGGSCVVNALEAIDAAAASGSLDERRLLQLAAMLESAVPLPRPQNCFDGSRIAIKAAIEYVYERNTLQRLEALTNHFGDRGDGFPTDAEKPAASDPPLKGWLPKAQTLAQVDEMHDNAKRLATLSFSQRQADPFKPGEFEQSISSKTNPVFAISLPAIQKLLASVNQFEMQSAGTKTIVALERYRLKHGRYPAATDALLPEFLPALPLDPFTDEPLLYKGPAPEPYPGGRPYLLYSAGYDQTDNGGAADPENRFASVTPSGAGLDFVLNPAPRPLVQVEAAPEPAIPPASTYERALKELQQRQQGGNAWDVILAIRDRLDLAKKETKAKTGVDFDWRDLIDEPGEPRKRDAAKQALTLARTADLDTLIQFAEMYSRMERPVGARLHDIDISDIATVKACGHLSFWSMREAASKGEWEEWLRWVHQAADLAALYDQDVSVVAYLANLSIRSMVLSEVRREIARGRMPSRVLAGLRHFRTFRTSPPRSAVWIESSRITIHAGIAALYRVNDGSAPKDVAFAEAIAKADEVHDHAARLQMLPFPERSADPFKLSAWEESLDREKHPVLSEELPAFERVFRVLDRVDAEVAGTATLIALEQYRAQHGSYPERALDLVPEFLARLPLDPYTGQPLVYRKLSKSRLPDGLPIEIYSVGENQIDDGGTIDPADPRRWFGKGVDCLLYPVQEDLIGAKNP